MSAMRLSKITYADGTEKFLVEEVREHTWGNSIHPVMHSEHSQAGSIFTPVTLTREQVEEAL